MTSNNNSTDDGSLSFLNIQPDEANKHFNCPETTQQKLINLQFWLIDFIEDVKNASPSHVAGVELLKDYIKEAMKDLSPREQKILEMRFGLSDGVTHTLEEVGKEFDVTRERIRQIEAKALEKIHSFGIVGKLKDY